MDGTGGAAGTTGTDGRNGRNSRNGRNGRTELADGRTERTDGRTDGPDGRRDGPDGRTERADGRTEPEVFSPEIGLLTTTHFIKPKVTIVKVDLDKSCFSIRPWPCDHPTIPLCPLDWGMVAGREH